MELRTILYGYQKEHLNYYVVPEEAKTVQKIFADYISGKTLKEIADGLTKSNVVYYRDRTNWTKNTVCRILENPHYIGDTEYPSIVSKNDYECVAAIKEQKGGAREKDIEEIVWLKNKMQCGVCGHRITRYKHYSGTHERWLCTSGCKTALYIDDAVLFQKLLCILNDVIATPSLLKYDESSENYYEPTLEILRNEREVARMTEQKNPKFLPIKKVIFECAAQKFDCCRTDYSKAVTDVMISYIEQLSVADTLDFKLLKKVADNITVYEDGSLSVRFLNHKLVYEKEETENANDSIAEGRH